MHCVASVTTAKSVVLSVANLPAAQELQDEAPGVGETRPIEQPSQETFEPLPEAPFVDVPDGHATQSPQLM